jgi:hypothetical protein
MFLVKKLGENVYKFNGENKKDYSLALKNKFLNMEKINQKFNIMRHNSIPYNINPIFSAKELNFNANDLFIIQFYGYIEAQDLFSFYDNYEQIFHFLMNIKAIINIPPTEMDNEFTNNLEIKNNICVLYKNKSIYLIFSKKIANNLPFEITKIYDHDCFYLVEIKDNDIIFFISKKFNIPITNIYENNKVFEDKLYQLFNEKIILIKDNTQIIIDLENNYLGNKRKIDDLLEKNEEKTKQIQDIKLKIIDMQKQNSKILQLEEEKEELIIKLNKERNNNIKKNKKNNLIITQSITQQMFIPSEYDYNESNNSLNYSYNKDIDTEIKNESIETTLNSKYLCCNCFENERNIFFKDCNHISLCENCAIEMGKTLKKNKSKNTINLKIDLKNGKLKLNCPICQKETYCYSCEFS